MAHPDGRRLLHARRRRFDPAAARLIDEKTARRYQAVPVRIEARAAWSSRWRTRATCPRTTTSRSSPAGSGRCSRGPRRSRPCSVRPPGSTRWWRTWCEESGGGDDPLSRPTSADASDDAPIVRLVNSLIARAVDERASDIHIEPQARRFVVRYRVDGVLARAAMPRRLANGVASRLKIMAEIDIAERRVPQDGRIGLTVGGKRLRPPRRDAADGVRREDRACESSTRAASCVGLDKLGFAPRHARRDSRR